MGSIQLGIPYTYLMLTASRKLWGGESETKCRGAVRVGTFGAILEYGLERRVTKHSTLGATVVVGVPTGVTLRLKLTRGQQTYTLPLHLADEVLPQPVFYGTVTPVIVFFAVKRLVVDPWERRRRDRERRKMVLASKDR